MIEYRELELLTSIALEEPGDCFKCSKGVTLSGGRELNELDSKSFRVINRINAYMQDKNISRYTDLFPNGMIKVSKNTKRAYIEVGNFYIQL